MSAIVFSGAAQFAVLAVLTAGGSVVTAIVAATLIASRFLAIGVALGPSMRGGTVRRALEGQAVVDASLILARTGEARYGVRRLLGATLPQYPMWIIGTAVAVGITVVAVTAVAQSPVEPTQIVAQQTLTNRSESPFSEIDFRLGDHQHLKGYFLDNSRDRLLR